MTTRRAALFLLAATLAAIATPSAAAERTITVFAAASLKTVLDRAAAAFETAEGAKVVLSYAASGPLARQILEGAPADVFISADRAWMDTVEKAGAIDPATRTVIAGNGLVLIAPADSTAAITLGKGADLAGLLGDGRLAVGEPKAVPAGAYAVEALTNLGILSAVEPRFAPAESVRAALALVATGEAPLGIVYTTDAKVEPKVRVVAPFPDDSHSAIVYPAAVVATSADPKTAAGFVAFLASGPGHQALLEAGFTAAK